MTAQIPDRVIYQGEPYDIVGMKGTGFPSPEDFGLSPVMMSTACYRGYYCDYTVKDNLLLLTHLVIRTKDRAYPAIGGVHAITEKEYPLNDDDPEPELLRGMYIFSRYGENQRYVGYDAPIYAGLMVQTQFSGGLLIAKDFIGLMYVHMGFQKPTSFKTVIELLFEEGKLMTATDHSQKMAEMRLEMVKRQLKIGFDDKSVQKAQMMNWIKWTFSLDYDL